MISREGRIIAIADGMATIRIDTPAGCGACGTRSVCGSGRGFSLSRPVHAGARPGDAVMLAIEPGALTRGAMIAYLLPATATLAGAAVMASWGDLAAVGGALSGLGLGLIAMRMLARRRSACDAPAVLPAPTLGAVPPDPTFDSPPIGDAP